MRQSQILVLGQGIMFLLLLIALVVFKANRSSLRDIVGLLLMVAGVGIALYSIQQHPGGPNISPEPKPSKPLVESGLYRYIRHPIYTGVLLTVLGITLAHGHPALLLIWILFVIFFTYKSFYEETLLRKAYPQYGTYQRKTGRFLPPMFSQGQ
jgi:protein-S-isoprenylcysteine O-methyltransferase Ste14